MHNIPYSSVHLNVGLVILYPIVCLGNAADVSGCVKDLKDVEDAKCPSSYRMNVTACMDCEDECVQVQPPGIL